MSDDCLNAPQASIHATARSLRAGEQRCVEILEQCLRRIDERESQIRAWVRLDREGAMARAQQLDQDLADGRIHGPLHGIPVGIKDIIDVSGLPTAAGSSRLAEGPPVSGDAAVVTGLRDAGAVILGKTVTTQFACFDPSVTANPLDPEHTPGGSSSGSAAAVASGMCLGALGSQTGGSITRPASFCGVAGAKPTRGRVSRRGVYPVAWSLDHVGPIAGCVRDLAILLDCLSGHDSLDPDSADRLRTEIGTYLEAKSLVPPRVGRLRGLFEERAEPTCRATFDWTLAALAEAGAEIAEVALPKSFAQVLESHRCIMTVEAAAVHEKRFAEHRGDYQPKIASMIEEGLAGSAVDYARSRRHQRELEREMLDCFAHVDVLACPATIGPAPDRSTTGDSAFNAPWSFIGYPTVNFPMGQADNGLPLGIQLVGRPFAEHPLFRAALWCEQTLAKGAATG